MIRKIAAVLMVGIIVLTGMTIGVGTAAAGPTSPVPTDDSQQEEPENSEVVEREEETEVIFAFSDRARVVDYTIEEDEVTLWIEADSTVNMDVQMTEQPDAGDFVTSRNNIEYRQTLSSEGVNKITFSDRDTYDIVQVSIDGEAVGLGFDSGEIQTIEEGHSGIMMLLVGLMTAIMYITYQLGWLPVLWKKLFPRDLI